MAEEIARAAREHFGQGRLALEQAEWGGKAPWADIVLAALDTAPRV